MPCLPFELERLIFEIAVLQDINRKHRIQIILVAKRVYEWIRPILYRVVIIGNDLLETFGSLIIHNLPNAQITNSAQFVRHLSLPIPSSDDFLEIISTFPNIENLQIWDGTIGISHWQVLKKLNDLPLRKLSLYHGFSFLHSAINLPHCQAFENLTHLEIVFLVDQDELIPIHLPNLTHLSFTFSYPDDAVVLDSLKHCASLRVLICLINTRRSGHYSPIKLDDPRYLVLHDQVTIQGIVGEWAKSANGLIGCWKLAEFIIEARKAKLFKDPAPSVLPRKTWMEHLNEDGRRWYKEWVERN